MCGIAGVTGSSDVCIMQKMLSTIAHRGPDDSGLESFDNLPHMGRAVFDP
jgi:asparagine synthetase B (glutamine-hydrolysing)